MWNKSLLKVFCFKSFDLLPIIQLGFRVLSVDRNGMFLFLSKTKVCLLDDGSNTFIVL